MTEFIILDAGGVLVAPRMGDWLTPVRFEEIIGETRLAAVSKKQLKRAMEESARVYLDAGGSVGVIGDYSIVVNVSRS